jgi:hypothetical protein
VWSGSLLFIRSITYPSGSIFAFTVKEKDTEATGQALAELLSPLHEQKVLVTSTVIEDREFLHGAKLVIQTLKGGALRPNTLFLTLGKDKKNDEIIEQLAQHAMKQQLGVLILHQHSRTAFGMQQHVNLWLRDRSPNWHLAVLIALQLQMNWGGQLNLITSMEDENDRRRLNRFLTKLSDQARLPAMTEFHILVGKFSENLERAPRADVNIFGLAEKLSFDFMRSATESTKSSCVFVGDSGQESALA